MMGACTVILPRLAYVQALLVYYPLFFHYLPLLMILCDPQLALNSVDQVLLALTARCRGVRAVRCTVGPEWSSLLL